MDQDAVPLAEHLDRTDARARPAEDVLGEDRPCRRSRVTCRDRGHEGRDVDARGAADDAWGGRVRSSTLEAAVRLDNCGSRAQRRAKLAGQLISEATHVRSVRRWTRGAIGVIP